MTTFTAQPADAHSADTMRQWGITRMVQEKQNPQLVPDPQAAEDEAQAAYLADWRRTHPPRRTSWRDVAGLLAVPVILGGCALALYLFTEWQALGGWMH